MPEDFIARMDESFRFVLNNSEIDYSQVSEADCLAEMRQLVEIFLGKLAHLGVNLESEFLTIAPRLVTFQETQLEEFLSDAIRDVVE